MWWSRKYSVCICVAGAGGGSSHGSQRSQRGNDLQKALCFEKHVALLLCAEFALHVQAPAVDPFDALASILPSADPVAPEPVYKGPEVKEVQNSCSVHACVCAHL